MPSPSKNISRWTLVTYGIIYIYYKSTDYENLHIQECTNVSQPLPNTDHQNTQPNAQTHFNNLPFSANPIVKEIIEQNTTKNVTYITEKLNQHVFQISLAINLNMPWVFIEMSGWLMIQYILKIHSVINPNWTKLILIKQNRSVFSTIKNLIFKHLTPNGY